MASERRLGRRPRTAPAGRWSESPRGPGGEGPGSARRAGGGGRAGAHRARVRMNSVRQGSADMTSGVHCVLFGGAAGRAADERRG